MKKRREVSFGKKPIYVEPGDELTLAEKTGGEEREILMDIIDRKMVLTKAVTFDVEGSDGLGGIGIGGAFIEEVQWKKDKAVKTIQESN